MYSPVINFAFFIDCDDKERMVSQENPEPEVFSHSTYKKVLTLF